MTKTICDICGKEIPITTTSKDPIYDLKFCISSYGKMWDICKWELKNACYTTSIKHYYSLPTSIVKTFNNCPYCGKKIKVVE